MISKMYRIEDKEFISKFKKHINKYEADKTTSYDLYYRNAYLYDLWDCFISKTKETLLTGRGNVLSDIVFLFKDTSDYAFVNFISGILNSEDINMDDVYMTYLNKSTSKSVNKYILDKEIHLLKPKFIICFNDLNLPIEFKEVKVLRLNRESISKSIELINNNELNYNDPRLLGKFKKFLRGYTEKHDSNDR